MLQKLLFLLFVITCDLKVLNIKCQPWPESDNSDFSFADAVWNDNLLASLFLNFLFDLGFFILGFQGVFALILIFTDSTIEQRDIHRYFTYIFHNIEQGSQTHIQGHIIEKNVQRATNWKEKGSAGHSLLNKLENIYSVKIWNFFYVNWTFDCKFWL